MRACAPHNASSLTSRVKTSCFRMPWVYSETRRQASEFQTPAGTGRSSMVELYRAEARLREAESVPVDLAKGKIPFAWLCRQLEEVDQERPWQTQGLRLRAEFIGSNSRQVEGDLRRAN